MDKDKPVDGAGKPVRKRQPKQEQEQQQGERQHAAGDSDEPTVEEL